jgi:DNA-binding NarL/FixJ family response regulator
MGDRPARPVSRWTESAAGMSEASVPDFILTPRENAVVRLLARGYTDARAARELHISERSVSNIVRSMMDKLGVDNRFQMGVALGLLAAAPVPPGMLPQPAGRPDAGSDTSSRRAVSS